MRRIMEQDTQDIGINAEYLQRTPFIGNGERYRKAPPRPTDAELQNEYNYILAENITKKLLEKGLIAPETLVVVEYDCHVPRLEEAFTCIKERRFGDTHVRIYRLAREEETP